MQQSGKKVTETELAQRLTGRELRLYEIQAAKDIATVANVLGSKKHNQKLYLIAIVS